MAYLGTRFNHGSRQIEVKFHGPLDHFSLSTTKIRNDIIDKLKDENVNLVALCKKLSSNLIDEYGDLENILWVQVEVFIPSNGILVGASAEKV